MVHLATSMSSLCVNKFDQVWKMIYQELIQNTITPSRILSHNGKKRQGSLGINYQRQGYVLDPTILSKFWEYGSQKNLRIVQVEWLTYQIQYIFNNLCTTAIIEQLPISGMQGRYSKNIGYGLNLVSVRQNVLHGSFARTMSSEQYRSPEAVLLSQCRNGHYILTEINSHAVYVSRLILYTFTTKESYIKEFWFLLSSAGLQIGYSCTRKKRMGLMKSWV